MIARRPRLELGGVHRRVLALLVVAVLAVPVVAAANELRVHVDGEVIEVLSFEATVADVLEEQGVELAAGDEVLPAPSTPLSAVDSVTVLRTIDVTLVVDGEEAPMRGTWRTVEGLLADTGTTVADGQLLRPGPRTVLHDGDVVTITSPSIVTLVADGTTRSVETHLDEVGQVLDALGVEVGEADLLSPVATASLPAGTATEVVLRRVRLDEEVEEVTLPFAEEVRGTSELWEGQSRVVREGVEGLRVDTYEVRLVDGEPAGRTLASSVVEREPVTRVVEQGTTPRPPPPSRDDGSVWYDLARCESGGRWDYNGGSGYDGGLQFHPDTWRRWKPAGYPDYAWQASAEQQITVGKRLQAAAGWGAWPSCSRKLGLS